MGKLAKKKGMERNVQGEAKEDNTKEGVLENPVSEKDSSEDEGEFMFIETKIMGNGAYIRNKLWYGKDIDDDKKNVGRARGGKRGKAGEGGEEKGNAEEKIQGWDRR